MTIKREIQKPYILFDTNAIYNDYLLKSNRIQSLKRYVKVTGATIIVPSILREEVLKQYRKDWANARIELEKINKKFNNLVEVNHMEAEAMSIFKQQWEDFIADTSAVEIDSARLDLATVIYRSINEIKPFGEHSRGFRDTILWLSAIEFLKKQKDKRAFVFITNNKEDFGKNQKLFDNLYEEIQASGRRQIKYYSNLPVFLTEYANISDIINDDWVNNTARRVVEDYLYELVKSRQEEIYEKAFYEIEENIWDKLLAVDPDNFHLEDIFIDDFTIDNYYVYAENDEYYFVQLDIAAALNVVIAMPVDSDHGGVIHGNHPTQVLEFFSAGTQVSKVTKATIVVHEEDFQL